MATFRGVNNAGIQSFTAGNNFNVSFQFVKLGTTDALGNKTLVTPTANSDLLEGVTITTGVTGQGIGLVPRDSGATIKIKVATGQTVALGDRLGSDATEFENAAVAAPNAILTAMETGVAGQYIEARLDS